MKYSLLFILMTSMALVSCRTATVTENASDTAREQAPVAPARGTVRDSQPASARAKAVLFRTNGDYADNVMIRVSPDGNVIYYPAPTDISAASAPIPVADGWMLDRQGAASPETAFLKWTYTQYAALPSVPTLAEMKAAIIPDAKVTETKILPISPTEAAENPENLKQYLTPIKINLSR